MSSNALQMASPNFSESVSGQERLQWILKLTVCLKIWMSVSVYVCEMRERERVKLTD